MAYQLAPLLTSVLLVTLSGAYAEDPAADLRRMAVITSLIPAVPPSANRGAWASSEAVNLTAALRATENGTLQLSVGILDNVTREEMFSEWVDLGSPSSSVKVVSNPSATYTVNKTIQVFVQCSDGQVYYLEQMPKHAVYFVTWYSLPGSLPVDRAARLVGRDSVSALMWKGKVAVFVRSMQVASHLYWCTGVARSCTSFVVDLVEETEIWFKDRAASNNFRLLKGYKQGGVCVGRVVKACINLDSNITKALVY
ncbi:hypothetical protein Bbelb_361020 [Branchiostoma belcheri]|nr:hypothetical protein Bbelb_361020 [Branchiostoma belcheri]